MDLTPEEIRQYALGWKERRDREGELLRQRRQAALAKAREAARIIREKYGARRVLIFGSLAGEKFNRYSDIDMAVEGLADPKQYLKVYGEVEDIVAPFRVHLLLIEDLDRDFREKVYGKGVEL